MRPFARHRDRPLRSAARLLTVVVLCGACGTPPGQEPAELEVVEVDAGATAQMTPEGDATEPERGPALAGGLPPSFPRDLPLPLPASVTEFSAESDSSRWVVLRAADPLDAVRRSLPGRFDRAGWRSEGGDPWVRAKDGRRIRIRLDADPVTGGALVRVEY